MNKEQNTENKELTATFDNHILYAVIESTTGYSCPNCGAICSEKTIVLNKK